VSKQAAKEKQKVFPGSSPAVSGSKKAARESQKLTAAQSNARVSPAVSGSKKAAREKQKLTTP
jgi:hypothetical protein